jgi:hypothetical protein
MFKNRAFQVKVVKDQQANGDGPFITPDPMLGPEIAAAYAEVAKDLITHAALTIGGVYAACKIIGRICK